LRLLARATFPEAAPGGGARPGTLVVPASAPPPKIRAICYDAVRIDEHDIERVLEPVRMRVRDGLGPIRTAGPGYLAYATPRALEHINTMKALLAQLQRGRFPQREAIGRMIRETYPAISDEVRVYLRDTYDQACSSST